VARALRKGIRRGPLARENGINYVGALRVARVDNVPQIAEDRDVTPQQADDFVTQTFPNISDHVVSRPMESIYTGMDCACGLRGTLSCFFGM
jgi:hypothetical protein